MGPSAKSSLLTCWLAGSAWATVVLFSAQAEAREPAGTPPADPSSGPIAAPRPSQVPWQPEWVRTSLVEGTVVFGASALAVGSLLFARGDRPSATHGLGLDEGARDLLRADSASVRSGARTTSDVLAAVAVVYPTVGEALLNAGWYRQSGVAAESMFWMDLEALAIGTGLASLVKVVVARQRPYGRLCGSELDADSDDCTSTDRYLSHFSGHSETAFAAATLSCMHQQHLPLYGATPPWVGCATGYTLASTTAVLRVVADRHYLSDVAVGAAVGTFVGWLVPALHYRAAPRTGPAKGAAGWMVAPTLSGFVASGTF